MYLNSENSVWRRINGRVLSRPLAEEVEEVLRIQQDYLPKLSICVGTDSEVRTAYTKFATVIVFLREGAGGFMFLRKTNRSGRVSLKQRMIQEVSISIEVAYELAPLLKRHGVPMEVHADINPDPRYLSSQAFKEAMGYIKGMGFTFKAKPDAFASSCCADRFV
jgi:predicted RNase H-related nuclease YkuK (DUF458 family)